MKHIPMSRRGAVTVKLPPLSGGVNLYDTPTEAADNQLTACENMWFHKGALRTRPGVKAVVTPGLRHGNVQMINEREMISYALNDVETKFFRYIGIDGEMQEMGTINDHAQRDSALLFRAPHNDEVDWYILTSNGDMLQSKAEWGNTQLEYHPATPYVPTVMINGYGGKDIPTASACGDLYEDYNMLTPAFKCQFTTDGESTYFQLPEKKLGRNDCEEVIKIKLTLSRKEGDATVPKVIEVTIQDQPAGAEMDLDWEDIGYDDQGTEGKPTLVIRVDAERGLVSMRLYAGQSPMPEGISNALPRVVNNNLEITAWRGDGETKKRRDTICKMTRCTWYGGTRSGIGGGTRLFVCGNPDEPNLVHWSGIEHPLYFPEHNYNRIGDSADAVTGFGKQGELLVIFKEHQIYAAQYDAAEEADCTFATESGVAITTYAAQFPVTPLNDTIGCDCPDTVRLVNNRLVWANSNGHVYMLTGTNQYSERNVRDISRNITAAMAEQGAALKTAVAGEYEGYYLLAVEDRMYLLDTQNSAFASFNHYSSEDNARKALPWYIWQLPFAVRGMISDGYRVAMLPTVRNVLYEFGGDTDSIYGEDKTLREGVPIAAHFATKMFDFNMPDRTKRVGQIYMGAHVVPEGAIALTYRSEKGSRRDPYEIDGGELAALGSEGGLRSVRLTPYMNLIQTFGIQADATATMAVDGITIKVQQQGVVR